MTRLFHAALATVVLSAIPAFAGPVAADGTWHAFLFAGTGSFGVACATSCSPMFNPVPSTSVTSPWTFSGPAVVTVLDLFNAGDMFNVYNNDVLIGTTSFPGGGSCGNDIGNCLANPKMSRGIFVLGAGSHSLTIEAAESPFGSGAAAFQVAANPVPEPGTMMLLSAAGVALAALRRRK